MMLKQTDTDESLMIAYAKGNADAFEFLYARHKGPMYRYFIRQVSSIELAQDLYQECWSRIIKSAHSYLPTAKWTTWAYRMAHNLCIDHFRTVKQLDSYDDFYDSTEHESYDRHSIKPENSHEMTRLSEQLKSCMARLPTVQREVFLLSQETDMTLKMVSDVVSASYESVKTRLRYAKSKLQECLQKYHVDGGEL